MLFILDQLKSQIFNNAFATALCSSVQFVVREEAYVQLNDSYQSSSSCSSAHVSYNYILASYVVARVHVKLLNASAIITQCLLSLALSLKTMLAQGSDRELH